MSLENNGCSGQAQSFFGAQRQAGVRGWNFRRIWTYWQSLQWIYVFNSNTCLCVYEPSHWSKTTKAGEGKIPTQKDKLYSFWKTEWRHIFSPVVSGLKKGFWCVLNTVKSHYAILSELLCSRCNKHICVEGGKHNTFPSKTAKKNKQTNKQNNCEHFWNRPRPITNQPTCSTMKKKGCNYFLRKWILHWRTKKVFEISFNLFKHTSQCFQTQQFSEGTLYLSEA